MNSYDTLIRSTLKNIFGFDNFREGQVDVIEKILEGKSALAVFPTGSGKSLCYQLSALLLDGLTLVISPLIALMKDQIDFLHERNIPAARLDSTLELRRSVASMLICKVAGLNFSTSPRNVFLMSVSSRNCAETQDCFDGDRRGALHFRMGPQFST